MCEMYADRLSESAFFGGITEMDLPLSFSILALIDKLTFADGCRNPSGIAFG